MPMLVYQRVYTHQDDKCLDDKKLQPDPPSALVASVFFASPGLVALLLRDIQTECLEGWLRFFFGKDFFRLKPQCVWY